MSVMIVCGGTGGHLSPGIAISEELQSRGYFSVLCISKKEIDAKIIKKYNSIEFEAFKGRGFSGGLLGKLLFFAVLVLSLKQIIGFIIIKKPKVILLMGGYLSVGFGLAGLLLRKKIIIHEANAKAGKSSRLFKRFATRVYLPYGLAIRNTKSLKIKHVGYPLRKEILRLDKQNARSKIGIDVDGFLVVVLGGSQGAEILNNWVIDNFQRLAEECISIYCITGINSGLESSDIIKSSSGNSAHIKLVSFSDNMSAVLSAADLVISRAGAGSIAEIIKCKIPSILIPYPYAADNHQLHNAKFHESIGAGIALDQKIVCLFDELKSLLSNSSLLDQMKSNLDNLQGEDSTKIIVNDIESTIDFRKDT